jgi:hypothetical protein
MDLAIATTVSVNVAVFWIPEPSRIATTMLNVPSFVGVPEMTPPVDKESPLGKLPADNVHVGEPVIVAESVVV